MVERQRFDVKLLFIKDAPAVAAWEFLNSYLERELKVGSPKRGIQEHTQAFGSEDIERRFPAIEVKRAEKARDAVKMVSVKVSDEYRMNPAPLYRRSHQLQLRAFTAIEQEHISFAD